MSDRRNRTTVVMVQPRDPRTATTIRMRRPTPALHALGLEHGHVKRHARAVRVKDSAPIVVPQWAILAMLRANYKR